jgi:hypothetical protein
MLGRLYWVSIELKASLAKAEAEVGAVANADQKFGLFLAIISIFIWGGFEGLVDDLLDEPNERRAIPVDALLVLE